MSEVEERLHETVESVKNLVESVTKATRAEIHKTAPNLSTTLDKSFQEAARGLSDVLSTIEKGTNKQQKELLKSYKSFLQKQAELIDGRLKKLEKP